MISYCYKSDRKSSWRKLSQIFRRLIGNGILNLVIISAFLLLVPVHTSEAQAVNVRINEFMAINQSVIADENGDFSDWIELFNTGSETVNLKGWALTDDKKAPAKWVFPDVSFPGKSYLVIFASDKNRNIPGRELHTNFKLDGDGEYLALNLPGGTPVTRFDPFFPVQSPNGSYGYAGGYYALLPVPTPGAENSLAWGTITAAPVFSRKHGFFDDPIELEIISQDTDANIFYTTDGSTPGLTTGKLYSGPLTIDSTTVIRAVCTKDGKSLSKISTSTYIFPESVIRQGNRPDGYPALWGPYIRITGVSVADYEMDPEMMADHEFAGAVKAALKDIPTVSLVTDKGYLFENSTDPDKGGIYIYTGATETSSSRDWERPVSFEYFDSHDSVSLQVDCGLKIQGGEGRVPEKSPKHSFRLLFKSEYGPSELNFPLFGEDAAQTFNSVILRAGFNKTWAYHGHSERAKAQYIHDIWAKDTQREMGHNSSNGFFVHLYINGLYWGLYNPSERLDSDYAESYLGRDENEYDVIKDYNEVVDGDLTMWNKLMQTANAGLVSTQSYNRIRGYNSDGIRDPRIEALVDVTSLADYMILNFYAGNIDWDHHNWVAVRNRVQSGSGFTFFIWDAERIMESTSANMLAEDNNNCPSHVFQKLRQNSEFRRLFADRVQKFCFDKGVLTPESAAARWIRRSSQVEEAVLAESARWGDYRRDVHQWQTDGPFALYTKEEYWIPQMNYMLDNYFPKRTDNFVKSLRDAKLFPEVNAPVFMLNGKPLKDNRVSRGDILTITSAGGIIYYTTDGSDPVDWTAASAASSTAVRYSQQINITQSSHIKARVLSNGEWSATSEGFFIVPADFHDIKITEIHYNPADQDEVDDSEFEFIEIKNTGTSTLCIGGLKFVSGIDYRFPAESCLGPGDFIVLSSNSRYFVERYGFLPYGEYGGQLDNSGELLVLTTAANDTICSFAYGDGMDWPAEPDGDGYSLVPVEFNPVNSQEDASDWRVSHNIGGSPGADDMLYPDGKASGLFTLFQNYPNPFADLTNIFYKLNVQADIELAVFSISGQKIITLEKAIKPAGYYKVEWDGSSRYNGRVPDGIYFYRLAVRSTSGSDILTGKMMLIR